MKYFREPGSNHVLALESDGSQDQLITPTMVQLSASDVQALLVPSIPDAKSAKATEIELARDAACQLNVSALGTVWQADERSQKLLGDALTLAMIGAPLPPVWRDALNTNLSITNIAQLATIAGAMAVQTQAAYVKSWVLKGYLDTASTVAEIDAIVW